MFENEDMNKKTPCACGVTSKCISVCWNEEISKNHFVIRLSPQT